MTWIVKMDHDFDVVVSDQFAHLVNLRAKEGDPEALELIERMERIE